ncbi:hypothetical protein CTI30_21320, partial [Bacillus velezensis]|nr:hypothetical protein [Bacillus velezensis]
WKNKTLNEDRSQTVDFTEGEPEEASDNQHKRLNRIQEQGFNFYVTSKIGIPKPESNYTYQWEQYSGKLEQI